MRSWNFGLLLLLGSGCTPDLGPPSSLIQSNRILAIKGDPAEAMPGTDAQFTTLTASPGGSLASPKLTWSLCTTPKPLSENNSVAGACLGESDGGVQDLMATGPMITATISSDACSLFGPETPPPMEGQPPLRPRDPDVTGGFYQPIRIIFIEGASNDGDLYSFGQERISCNLANAPIDVVIDYRKQYMPNNNPKLLDVTGAIGSDGAKPLVPEGQQPDGTMLASVPTSGKVTLHADWTSDSAESYPVYNRQSHVLDTHRETLRVSWYASAGSFDVDASGRGEDEMETFAENTWTAPKAAGSVYIWAVLRDARGGTDWKGFLVAVE